MRWRSEAELAVALEAVPLREKVEAHASCKTKGAFQCLAARQHVGKAGDAFQAFVGRRDKIVRLPGGEIDRHAAKAAHRIDDEPATLFVHDPRDFIDGV
jgi:hypothetical protein